MKKTIKTMQGRDIDFEKMLLQNENTIAVGNMFITTNGNEVKKAEYNSDRKKSKKTYRRQIRNKVRSLPVFETKKDSVQYFEDIAINYKKTDTLISEIEDFDKITEVNYIEPKQAEKLVAPNLQPQIIKKADTEVSSELLQEVINRPADTISSAMAQSKSVKQQPIKSPREQLRSSDGVKKI